MFKRYVSTAMAMMLLFSTAAHAEAPTSQFGFTGWPYRQPTNCGTPVIPTSTPIPDDSVGGNAPESTIIPTKEPSVTTPAPTIPPTATIAPTRAPQPTAQPTATRAPSSDDDYTTDSISAQEQKAWNLLNQDRKANGLSALPLDPALSRIARIKSEDMRDNKYFAHQSPTYGSVRDMLRHFGYAFTAAGENIAHHATVEKSQAAFMSSDGHRRNILSSAWTKVGIGVSYDAQGFVYVTQIFAR